MAFLSDHLGSTSQLLDAGSGAPKARLDYKSYGKLEGDIDNPLTVNPYTYTGREDDGTGLMYYRARYYDPELEIFISQDPLGDAQRYVGGNPLGFTDPLGLEKYANLIIKVGEGVPFDTVGVKVWTQIPWNTPEVQINSAADLANFLSKNTVTNTLVLTGHGNPEELGLIKRQAIINKSNLGQAFSPISINKGKPSSNKAPNEVRLEACRTGSGSNSIAEILSRNLGSNTRVIAPSSLIFGGSGLRFGSRTFVGGEEQ